MVKTERGGGGILRYFMFSSNFHEGRFNLTKSSHSPSKSIPRPGGEPLQFRGQATTRYGGFDILNVQAFFSTSFGINLKFTYVE